MAKRSLTVMQNLVDTPLILMTNHLRTLTFKNLPKAKLRQLRKADSRQTINGMLLPMLYSSQPKSCNGSCINFSAAENSNESLRRRQKVVQESRLRICPVQYHNAWQPHIACCFWFPPT
jgi:hypothetical protein